jgi:hypothetical protein
MQGTRFDSREEEIVVIDVSETERKAMRGCLRHFGNAAERIGFTKPLGEYSESEAMEVIEAIVTGYTTSMSEHHEASRRSPLLGGTVVPDPMGSNSDAFHDDPIPF